MHNDEPALLDALDRGPLIKEVGDAIAHCTPPQVFGVHGDWGLGKTSFLHQVQWYLTGECPQQPETAIEDAREKTSERQYGQHKDPIRTVWFDAWRYQNEEAPVVALLHEMRAQLSWQSRVVGSISRDAEVLVRGALLSLEECTKKIGIQYSTFRQANREWESENLATTFPSHTLREHLCEAIRKILPTGSNSEEPCRLVVFIDDVDRCEPEAAYRLLEGLKIYLTLDNCVFVLGMNQKAIEEAIAQQMKAETDNNPKIRAAAYMEKLCQNVWRLPAVRQPEQMLYDLLEETVASEAVRGLIKQGLEEPQHQRLEGPECQCLPPNPRRLKGLANLIGRLSWRLPSQEENTADKDKGMIVEVQLLTIVAYVYQFHHELHVRWEAELGLYNEIYDWCTGTDRELPFLGHLELPYQAIQQPPPSMPRPAVAPPPPPPDERSAVSKPLWTLKSTYPDPTDANVFWIQPLILHLGSEATPQRFKRYLHEVTA